MVWSKVAGLTIAIIILCSFSMGGFQFLDLPLLIPKIISEGLAIVLFLAAVLLCLFKKGCNLNTFGLVPVGGVIASGLISGLLHDAGSMQLLIFVREILKFYLFFLALINLHIPERILALLLLLIIILFSIQIPVSWLKLFLVGIAESWIGTVHMNAGELSLLLPMAASSFLFAFFLYTRRMTYLILITFFFMFAIIGEKEAAPFVFHPLLIFLLWYYYSVEFAYEKWGFIYSIKRMLSLKNTVVFLLTWVFAVFISTQLLFRLNPEEKKMGTFDPVYVIKYAASYNMRKLEDEKWNATGIENNPAVQMGRFQVISRSFKQVVTEDIFTFLFGYGGGCTSESPWLGHVKGIMYKRFGIRGASPAMAKILLECGIVGLIFMLYLFLKFYRVIHLKLLEPGNTGNKGMILGILGMHVVFIFDFMMYSSASLFYGVLTPIYFFMLALLIKDQLIPFPGSK